MAFDDPEDVPGVEPPAETAPAVKREVPSTPSPSLDSLVTLPPGLTEALTDNKRAEIAQKGAVNKLFTQRAEEDRSRALDAYKATAIQPGELQPWDAEAARQKYKTDPLESFGSLGSVFAMIASAFTHAPMTNALNAGAAALNAIKDGKDQDYERAFKAFKENTDLALKRHGIMQQRYSDADKFRSSDLTQWRSEMQAVATQFDDQHMLTFLQAGFDKEALELVHKRNVIANDQIALSQATTKATFQQRALEGFIGQNESIEDPIMRASHNLAAFNRIYGVKQTPQQEIMGQWFFEHPKGTAEEAAKFYHDTLLRNSAAASQSETLAIYERDIRAANPDWTEAQVRDAAQRQMTRARTASNNNPTNDKRVAIEADVTAKHPDWSEGQKRLEVDRLMKEAANVITANERQKLEAHIDKFNVALDRIDKIVEPVTKKLGPVGLPGYATRLGERLGNFVGTRSTDYVQISRNIDMLKAWGTENLLDRSGRPLSAEHAQMNNIIAGMSMGDTVANTLRAYKELKELYVKMRDNAVTRLKGEWEPPAAGSGAPSVSGTPAAPARTPSWRDAPVVQ